MRCTLASADCSDTAGKRPTPAVFRVNTGPVRAAHNEYRIGKRLHWRDISDDGRWLFASVISDAKLVAFDPQTDVRRVLPLGPAPDHLGVVRGTGEF